MERMEAVMLLMTKNNHVMSANSLSYRQLGPFYLNEALGLWSGHKFSFWS
jgi:hypothetical protein